MTATNFLYNASRLTNGSRSEEASSSRPGAAASFPPEAVAPDDVARALLPRLRLAVWNALETKVALFGKKTKVALFDKICAFW